MGIIWTIIIGFLAGLIAKFIVPGNSGPSGFILTTILGIVGAFVASYLGQALGWYQPGEGAGLIGAIVGAIIVLLIWGAVSRRRGIAGLPPPDRVSCLWRERRDRRDLRGGAGRRTARPCESQATHHGHALGHSQQGPTAEPLVFRGLTSP